MDSFGTMQGLEGQEAAAKMKVAYGGECFETSPIGSRNQPLKVFLLIGIGGDNWRTQDQQLLFVTGCFTGGEKQFRSATLESYPEKLPPEAKGHQYRREYLAAIEAAHEFYRVKALEKVGIE